MICAKHGAVRNGVRGEQLWFFCPGCLEAHAVMVAGPGSWKWNGSLDKPTLEPSVLVNLGEGRRCHSFVKEGRIQFLGDCTHELAGKVADLPELPEWLA